MKILHITASYKPAFVYGGPVMSVAKLCEEVGRKSEDRRPRTEDGGRKSDDRSLRMEDGSQKSGDRSPQGDSETFLGKEGFDSAQPDKMMVTVYTTLANGKEELPYSSGEERFVDGISVKYFKRITKDHSHFSPTLLWHLWRTVKKFDLVHIHAWWNLVTMPACLIAYLRGVKVVLSPRGTLSTYSFETDKSLLKRLFHQLIGKRLLNSCFIHATSGKEAQDTLRLLTPKIVVNIPNFVAFPIENKEQRAKSKEQDAEKKGQNAEIKEQRTKNKEVVDSKDYLVSSFKYQDDKVLKMIFLSRIEQKKGLELLFDSLGQVDFPWELSIVGSGEKEYVQSLKWKVESGDLEQSINWLGAVYGEEKFKLLAQHDLFVLPSYDENFANVVIESLYSGTPVCISKNVGLSDYVSKNQLGWVFDRTVDQLTLQLNLAYDGLKNHPFDKDLLSKKVQEDFEEEKLTSQYLSFYQSVFKSRP